MAFQFSFQRRQHDHRSTTSRYDDDDDDDETQLDPESDYEAVLEARVDQALAKPTGVIKVFLGGTHAASLPINLYKLRGKVREVLADNSPRLKSITQDIGALSSTLVRLDCSNCAIESLPSELGALNCLQFLNLSNNRLTSFVWEVTGLDALVELDLSRNKIRYFSPQVGDKILSRAQPGLQPSLDALRGGGASALSASISRAQQKRQEQYQAALIAARRIFIDLWGNEPHFIKVADRGRDNLHALIPEAASTVCAICSASSFTHMPHVSARFIHIGASSADYDTAKMTRATPLVKFVPLLYPTCSADCSLALHTAEAWIKSLQNLGNASLQPESPRHRMEALM